MDAGFRPLVSIITPTYNHERYIGQCIESVLAQSYSNWEQVIIDDGSSDRTGQVVTEFNDPRIRYYHQERKGVFRLAETYNRALALCQGSLIAPLEGDDLWPSDRLAALVPAFADAGVIVSYGVCRGFSGDATPAPLVMPSAGVRRAFGRSALFNEPTGAVCAAMLDCGGMVGSATASIIRRCALEAIGGFQHFQGLPLTDYPTFLELGLNGKFAFTERTTSYWRRHANNTTTRQEEAILSGLFLCALGFLEKPRPGAGVPLPSRAEMEARWHKKLGRRAFWNGRRLLFRRQWKEARARFRRAFWLSAWPVRAGAVCGLAASYLQFNLEPLMELAGRGYPAGLLGNDAQESRAAT